MAKVRDWERNHAGKGKVHHAWLGIDFFGDRFDRRGPRLWWRRRHGKLYRADIVFRVSGAVHHQPGDSAGAATGCVINLGSIRPITEGKARRSLDPPSHLYAQR